MDIIMKNTETDVCSALKRVKTALESLRAKAAYLDGRIHEIKQAICRLQQSPISLEDFGIFLHASIVRKGLAWLVPARIVWTRFCNSGCLSHGISLTGFEG
ncbi:MAG TPA: hypothetical protein P5555_21495 [Candidatus Paceibacterota bacterium]|nr:hypothetical protein [Candidatus Paceibacterota bacterium]